MNTDFGETEADDLQTNLTRFSLFQAEKREFFLENSGIFEFGPGAAGAGALSVMSVGALSFGSSGSSGSAPLLKLFHSRQIGIDASGGKVPIDFGVRTTGRLGRWNVGVLDVQTDLGTRCRATGSPFSADELRRLPREPQPGRALDGRDDLHRSQRRRQRQSILRRRPPSPAEQVARHRQLRRADRDVSGRRTTDKTDWSAGLITTWNGPVWHAQGGWVHIGEDFDPQMGFLLRRGIDRYNGRADRRTVRQEEGDPEPPLRARRRRSTRRWTARWRPRSTASISSDSARRPDTRRRSSSPTPTTRRRRRSRSVRSRFPSASTDYNATGVSFLTHASRPVSVEGQLLSGSFYDGDRTSGNVTLRIRPNRFLRSETTMEINDVNLVAGSFVSKVYRQRLAMAVTPQVLANVFVQFNDLSRLASLNARFNWHYRPGSDIFVVYNQTWDGPSVSSLNRRDRQLMLKFTRLFQR